jgi:carbon monoxide dehydrogenase subunit G
MQMTDSQRIAAPREQVWTALNDPEVLKRCIPGCESLEMTSPNEMTASVVLKVGPVKAKFAGKVTLSDLDPPNGYRITGEGSGGVAGFAKGGATVRLEEDGPAATILHYEVDAQIGGKLAQLGGRLIDSTAKKLAAEFFDNLAGILAPATPEPVSEEAGESAAKKGWLGGLFSKPGAATTLIALIVAGALLGHACCLFHPAEAGMAEGFPICTGLAGTV